MFQKRGQEGVTLTTLILIIIGAVVAVVIILGATGTLNKIFSKGGAIPGNLEAVTQACILDAKNSLISDYCYTFKKIDDYEYINCEDERVKSSLTNQSIAPLLCDPTLVKSTVKNTCRDFSPTQKDRTMFNGNRTTNLNCAAQEPQ